jgi:hypothetical protein
MRHGRTQKTTAFLTNGICGTNVYMSTPSAESSYHLEALPKDTALVMINKRQCQVNTMLLQSKKIITWTRTKASLTTLAVEEYGQFHREKSPRRRRNDGFGTHYAADMHIPILGNKELGQCESLPVGQLHPYQDRRFPEP